ncbi:MAG: hypothetical protein ACFFDI_24340 [Promethearchaeota archaeon]
MVPRPKGEESEARNRAAFDSLGQKRRIFGIHWPELLRHTRRPISSASLGGWIWKAKPERLLLPFPCILPTQSGRESF